MKMKNIFLFVADSLKSKTGFVLYDFFIFMHPTGQRDL